MNNLRDFRPDIRAAVGDLHRAGFHGEAHVLAAAMEGAYGSALEMVWAIGGAVSRVERALGEDLPQEVETVFRRALAEVARVVAALTSLDAALTAAVAAMDPTRRAPCSSS